jgi:hypothetical protein
MLIAATAIAVAIFAIAACGDDEDGDDGASASSLGALIPPPSDFGPLKLEREFTWDNATDYVVQGPILPQITVPSDAIGEIEDDGFSAAAGNELVPEDGGPPVIVSVAAFDSEDGAADAQAYLHDQDLEQPCFAACSVDPQELEIPNVPGATAVHQVPLEGKLPPEVGPPFEGYVVEFVIGSNLFYVNASGPPGDIPAEAFIEGATAFYRHASETAGS